MALHYSASTDHNSSVHPALDSFLLCDLKNRTNSCENANESNPCFRSAFRSDLPLGLFVLTELNIGSNFRNIACSEIS